MAEEDKQGTGWRGLGMAGCGEDMVDGGRAGDLAGGGGAQGSRGEGEVARGWIAGEMKRTEGGGGGGRGGRGTRAGGRR